MKDSRENYEKETDRIVQELLTHRAATSLVKVEAAIARWRAGEASVRDPSDACLAYVQEISQAITRVREALSSGHGDRVLRDAVDAGILPEAEFADLVGRPPAEVEPAGSLACRPSKRAAVSQILADHSALLYVDARRADVRVPDHLRDPTLVLRFGQRLSPPIPDLVVNDKGVSGTLTFSGEPFHCYLPWDAVFAVQDETTGTGDCWAEDAPEHVLQRAAAVYRTVSPPTSPAGAGRHLRLVE